MCIIYCVVPSALSLYQYLIQHIKQLTALVFLPPFLVEKTESQIKYLSLGPYK